MMSQKYKVSYDSCTLATVEITDSEKAATTIKQMVEFWSGYEWDLEQADGDYTKVFLKNLAMYILTRQGLPVNAEGWAPLDGTYGVKVLGFEPYDFDEDLIEIAKA